MLWEILVLCCFVTKLITSNEFGVTGEHDKTIFKAANSSLRQRYLLYEVNPGEGFNLRRDVYIRMANMMSKTNGFLPIVLRSLDIHIVHPSNSSDWMTSSWQLKVLNEGNDEQWILVLPPWGRIYHWKSNIYQRQLPWSQFFDVESLRRHVPVIELEDWIAVVGDLAMVDELYYLQRYAEGWIDGKWTERYDKRPCVDRTAYKLDKISNTYHGWFWDYSQISAQLFECVSVQAEIRTFPKFLREETHGRSVMLHRAETLIHGMLSEWSREWWTARRSMRFSSKLIKIADQYRSVYLDSNDGDDGTVIHADWTKQEKALGEAVGGPYLAVHLRRRDFLQVRETVPSLKFAAKQITDLLKQLNLTKVYVASDAPQNEYDELTTYLPDSEVFRYRPDADDLEHLGDGGVAIIEQWICAHARYFTGTSSSTYSFRINEERSLLGFSPDSTFNRLCGDKEEAEQCKSQQPGRWFPKY